MSFWDNVKKFAQPYGDDEYDDYGEEEEELDDYAEEEEEQPASRSTRRTPAFGSSDSTLDFGSAATTAPTTSGFSGSVLNMNSGNKQELVLFHAKTFDDAAKASDELRNKRAVILNMENIDKALTRRVVDFLSGCVYALDGKVRKIAQSTYLFCPHSMEIVGDLENFQAEVDSYV